jgi:hypothetical protein
MTDDLAEIRPLGRCPNCDESLYRCPECGLTLTLARCQECGYIVGSECLTDGLCFMCLEAQRAIQQNNYEEGRCEPWSG